MPGVTLLAVSLTRRDPPLAEQVEAAVRAGAGVVELRVDRIGDAAAVEDLLQQPHEVPFILTVRRAEEGGAWEAEESRRIGLIERLGQYSPGLVDVEYAAWQRSADVRRRIGELCGLQEAPGASDEATTQKRDGRRGGNGGAAAEEGAGTQRGDNELILSHHDLHGTPPNLEEVFERLFAAPAGILKAVFTARDALDSCRVLEQLHRRGGRRKLIALAMGAAGLPARVLARKFGGFLTFAALARGAESAPGQPTVAELRDVYRWDAVNPRTRVFGVIGWPVARSLSPRLHNAAMAAEQIDGVYLPLPVGPTYADLAAFLDYVTRNGWLDFAGLSVTIPHKEHVARWLDERGYPLGEMARHCGAVNTLVRTSDGGWRGENTDAGGALLTLEGVPELAHGGLNGRTADVLGAGGVARAVVAALVSRGCRVTVYNRSEDRARTLAQQLRCDWEPWDRRSSGTGEILINCSSVGMTPDVESSPVSTDRLRPKTVVFDTVYIPATTRLLREACARGCRVVGGVELLVAQGAAQYELWHGRPAPRETLRQTLRAAL